MAALTCEQCAKRLSRKTARLIEGRVLCSTCMFTPQRMKGYRDRDGTRSAETACPAPVLKDCHARAEGIAQSSSPKTGDSSA